MVKAVIFIFKALGIKSVPYIPQVIPSMMNVIRDSDVGRDFLFQQLGSLINVVQQHIRNYLDNIFDLIKGDLLFFRGSADYAITNGEYRYRKGLNLWDS